MIFFRKPVSTFRDHALPRRRDAAQGRQDMTALIAIGWLLAIWAVVITFSVYFSQNLK
jgi:hypothetical protein